MGSNLGTPSLFPPPDDDDIAIAWGIVRELEKQGRNVHAAAVASCIHAVEKCRAAVIPEDYVRNER